MWKQPHFRVLNPQRATSPNAKLRGYSSFKEDCQLFLGLFGLFPFLFSAPQARRDIGFLCDMSAWFIIPERNLTYFTNLGKHDSDRVPHRKLTQYRKLPN